MPSNDVSRLIHLAHRRIDPSTFACQRIFHRLALSITQVTLTLYRCSRTLRSHLRIEYVFASRAVDRILDPREAERIDPFDGVIYVLR